MGIVAIWVFGYNGLSYQDGSISQERLLFINISECLVQLSNSAEYNSDVSWLQGSLVFMKVFCNTPVHDDVEEPKASPAFRELPKKLFIHGLFYFWVHTSEHVI